MSDRTRKLEKELRARGVRKKTAVALARAVDGQCDAKKARRALDDLACAVDQITERLDAGASTRASIAHLSDRARALRTPSWSSYPVSPRIRSWTKLAKDAATAVRAP